MLIIQNPFKTGFGVSRAYLNPCTEVFRTYTFAPSFRMFLIRLENIVSDVKAMTELLFRLVKPQTFLCKVQFALELLGPGCFPDCPIDIVLLDL